jgi:hypothetical protein
MKPTNRILVVACAGIIAVTMRIRGQAFGQEDTGDSGVSNNGDSIVSDSPSDAANEAANLAASLNQGQPYNPPSVGEESTTAPLTVPEQQAPPQVNTTSQGRPDPYYPNRWNR